MILITGAGGFIGSAVQARLGQDGVAMRLMSRGHRSGYVQVPEIGQAAQWSQCVSQISTVIHLAARVHVMRDAAADPLSEFRLANVEHTLNLARQAAAQGVRRFIFVSSIKVNGEESAPGKPFTADDEPAPHDPYGISKLEAERGLLQLAGATGMEVTIIRPVLVYGPEVAANMLSLMKLLHKGLPLPLGAIYNRRSLVGVDNLADLIVTCTTHPAAKNQVFLVSDDADVSTTELLQRLALALQVKPRLLPMPEKLLSGAVRLLGRGDIAQRLCGWLQVDITKTRQVLGWSPPYSFDTGLHKMALAFLRQSSPGTARTG